MAKLIKYIIILSTAVVANISSVNADDRIEGASNYLIGIADQNYQYIVEQRLKGNKYLKCYLPSIYQSLSITGLNSLMSMSADTWALQVETDLNQLLSSFLLSNVDASKLHANFSKLIDSYIELLQKIQIKDEHGELVRLDALPLRPSKDLKARVNKFSNDFVKAQNSLKLLEEQIAKVADDGCIKPGGVILPFPDQLNLIELTLNSLSDQVEVIASSEVYVDAERINGKSLLADLSNIGILELSNINKAELIKLEKAKTLEQKVLWIYSQIENKKSAAKKLAKSKGYQEFKEFSLMAVRLSEADSVDGVELALNAYLEPAVSFGIKRKYQNTGTLQAYFGVQYKDEQALLTVPVGMEVSFLTGKYPVGLFLGALEFAGPVNAQITDSNQSFNWGQLVEPKVGLTIGAPTLPLAFGVYYNWYEESIAVSIGLDMPLKRLF